MPPDMPPYECVPDRGPHSVNEQDIETDFIERLRTLKYTYRDDIHDRASLESNFRDKFEILNRVKLTDGEFQRLLDELITPDVFTAAVRSASPRCA
jgi:type I restriction enzyme R subunit